MGIKCFWLEPTDRQQLYLRRYKSNADYKIPECPGPLGYHDAMVAIEQSREVLDSAKGCWVDDGRTAKDFLLDPRWPTHCGDIAHKSLVTAQPFCNYQFKDSDEWQLFNSHIYTRVDTGEEMTLRDAPAGAMWDAVWFHSVKSWCGEDGRSLQCRLPFNHDWHIDGPCNNCTKPETEHKCWIRHGEPPNLTVDKNGNTCDAGAGSILTPQWHGFLRNGELVE